MAANLHASPPRAMHAHHGSNIQQHHRPNGQGPMPPGPPPIPPQQQQGNILTVLAGINEESWMRLGTVSELQLDLDGALACYEQALRHNSYSIPAMLGVANIYKQRDQFAQAIDYLTAITKLEENHGEVWALLGHCQLMLDNLSEAYNAYQTALYHLQNLREPRLWYGIGILYDRYGSLEHAEEAFSQVMRMAPDFEKANEIYFRLGIIYKQQNKYEASLDCFRYIVTNPPKPLTEEDIWFQIGHVHEQQKDYDAAKSAYKRVLDRDPKHAKVLQQLGWLHHQQSTDYENQESAIQYLEKSVASDQSDAQSWYLLGRCYMAQQKYPRAYEAYQQAVYRDGRNPTFWCSIGVLYYQINQYRDALDAYSRAIRLNPNISEVWYDLGTLYESCNNQTADALDAYQRAAELDPTNVHIKARLQLLRESSSSGIPSSAGAPLPQDVHPQAYQPQMNGPPGPGWIGGPPGHTSQRTPAPAPDYTNHLNAIQANPQQGGQPLQPYDQRDAPRPQNLPGPPRPQSPRQEPPRHFADPARGPQPPRRLSPSPKSRNAGPHYPGGQPPHPQHEQPPHQPHRIANPNYGPQPPNPHPHGAPPPPGPPQHGYGRTTPPSDNRPPMEHRPNSTGANLQQPYHHRPTSSLPPPGSMGPGPQQGLGPMEPRDREEANRTPIPPPKRHREWEEDGSKSDEKRQRMDEHMPRMSGVHDRGPSPPGPRGPPPPPQSQHGPPPPPPGREQQADEPGRRMGGPGSGEGPSPGGYHGHDGAHHPPPPPPPQSSQQQGPPPPPPPPNREQQAPQRSPPRSGFSGDRGSSSTERERPIKDSPPTEGVARKMEVDEDYDDEGEDDKRGVNGVEKRESEEKMVE